jgi:hypothetical protein
MLIWILSTILAASITVIILALGITPVFHMGIADIWLFTAYGGGSRRRREAYNQSRR